MQTRSSLTANHKTVFSEGFRCCQVVDINIWKTNEILGLYVYDKS